MRAIKPTTAWWCLAGMLTPEQIIETTASIGYAGIEFAPREQWDAVRDAGVRIVCVRGHNDISNGLNDPSQHDRIEREILANLHLAQEYDIPALVCFSGERKGLDDATGAANTIVGLQRVAKAAEDAGVVLALELLNSKVDHPDYQCDHTDWGVEVESAVESPDPTGDPAKPNVVMIVADDLDKKLLRWMPQTRRLIADEGASFDRYYVEQSTCCTSRASVLSGE